MREEQVVNVRGEEICGENGDDHRKIKANAVVRAEKDENGGVGADSGSPDLVADGGVASEEEHKVNGESHVTVSEGEKNCKDAESNGSAEETNETAAVDVVSRDEESECGNGENGTGSVLNGVVENEICGDNYTNTVADELVTDHDEFVVVGDSDVENGVVAENEFGGDVSVNGVEECEISAVAEVSGENGVVAVNQSDREFEAAVDVSNGVTEGTATTDENGGSDAQFSSDVLGRSESTFDKDVDKSVQKEIVVGADVSNEKDIVTNGNHEVDDGVEKDEVAVDVDSVSAATDVEQCAHEEAQSCTEKVQVEPVSDVGPGVQNRSAEPEPSECTEENETPVEDELGSKLERSEEGPASELVPEGENSTALNSTDVIEEDSIMSVIAVESRDEPSTGVCEVQNNALESEAESSSYAVRSDGEPSEVENNAVDSEVEPSTTNVVKSDGEPSLVENNAVDREAEPSSNAVRSDGEHSVDVSEMKSNAVESEAEPSDIAVQSETETSFASEVKNNAVEREAEPSYVAVHSESEPSYVGVGVQSESEPSYVGVQSESEPSDVGVQSESEPSYVGVQSESEPSYDGVQSESEPSYVGVQSESEPSYVGVQSESEPSVVSEMKNNVNESEAEPSNGAAPSESRPSDVSEITSNAVDFEAEPSNGTVQSESEPSADVSERKTDAVESEDEPPVKGDSSNHEDEGSRPAADALDGQNIGAEVVKKPFYYLIRVPRYDDDENIKEQIKNAFHQVEEKTKLRDVIRAETQTKKASCKDCGQEVRAAITAERAARDLLKSKRQEMDSVQSTMNRLNNAISVGDIDGKIRNMEHMIQHETLPLNEEKQLIRQIKQLKQNREELSSNIRKQDQSQQSLDQKDSIEEHFKHLQLLKKEMEGLRNNVLKAEATTKAARKKYNDECDKLNELLARFKAADDIRQEAYAKLQASKRQLHEKSKYFWEYRNAAMKGQELAAQGKKEELQSFCVDQVEGIMELWNKNDEFRKDYVRCNTRSTLRRLQTLDGRSLGPDEEPPVIPNAIIERASKNNYLVLQSTQEQEKKSIPTESVNIKDEPVSKVVVQKTERSQTTKAKKPTKPAPSEKPVARWGDHESDEDTKEEPVRTKEEEELILKADKARKEEEEAKLKEKRKLEEIEKAKEALQRKRRNAEKAQQRAAIKAQKEAEQKEKEREKRARKKQRKKAASAETAENTEQESAPSSEIVTSTEECDQSEKSAEVTRKSQKPSQFTRQTKVKSLPPALRNRGKRRIQPWMWVLIALVIVVALFYVGNSSTLRTSLEGFGF